jgi:hypothetical protein
MGAAAGRQFKSSTSNEDSRTRHARILLGVLQKYQK